MERVRDITLDKRVCRKLVGPLIRSRLAGTEPMDDEFVYGVTFREYVRHERFLAARPAVLEQSSKQSRMPQKLLAN